VARLLSAHPNTDKCTPSKLNAPNKNTRHYRDAGRAPGAYTSRSRLRGNIQLARDAELTESCQENNSTCSA